MTGPEVAAVIRAHQVQLQSGRCACGTDVRAKHPHRSGSVQQSAIDHIGAEVAERVAQARANATGQVKRGHRAVPAAVLTMADLGTVVRAPAMASDAVRGLLVGLDWRPSADGDQLVELEVLDDDQQLQVRTVRQGVLVEVWR